jgi:MSHA pilin protein MshD
MGTGIGQSMLEEILTKSFDENTITSSVNHSDSLTSVGSLGKDAGENSSLKYDDVDDYKNFTRSDTLENLGVFTTTVSCCYVNEANTDLKSYSQTFLKRIDVSVTGENLKAPLIFNYIVSY